jgi:hypothetical protein
MRYKRAGIIAVATLAFSFAGCNQTANESANTMANANANANANIANANAGRMAENKNANENANTSTRRSPTREEYERDKARYEREAKEAGRKIGTGLNDGWLWTKTRFDLAAADDLRDSTINVDVENAVVTLSGSVANAEQKGKAESVAKSVEGVKGVKNMLKVSATGNSNAANKNANRK